MKKISIIWGICVILIFGGLTTFGFMYKKNIPYEKLKKKMESTAEEYITEKDIKITKNLKITLDELKEYDIYQSFEIENDKCDGHVIISKGFLGNKYKAHIKCEKINK